MPWYHQWCLLHLSVDSGWFLQFISKIIYSQTREDFGNSLMWILPLIIATRAFYLYPNTSLIFTSQYISHYLPTLSVLLFPAVRFTSWDAMTNPTHPPPLSGPTAPLHVWNPASLHHHLFCCSLDFVWGKIFWFSFQLQQMNWFQMSFCYLGFCLASPPPFFKSWFLFSVSI